MRYDEKTAAAFLVNAAAVFASCFGRFEQFVDYSESISFVDLDNFAGDHISDSGERHKDRHTLVSSANAAALGGESRYFQGANIIFFS